MFTRLFSVLLIFFLFITGCGSPATPVEPASSVPSTAVLPTATTAGITSQATSTSTAVPLTYPIVDTGQGKCYDNTAEIPCPSEGLFLGQDAQYTGLEPGFTFNGDGSVTDNNTGLTWQQSPDVDGNGKINAADKLTAAATEGYCKDLTLAGSSDWRLPDIKTLYSLMDFLGTDPSGASGITSLIPFLNNNFFAFAYGDTSASERTIDAQFASSTRYVDTNTGDGGKVFGVNFADGRIKGYGLTGPGGAEKKFFVLCARGNDAYGVNHFVDNGDETVTDEATGLVWQKADNTGGLDWQGALAYCEALSLAGKDDWRLPDAKALQSLLDYTRSPATTSSPAIDALFSATEIKNEAGQADYPFYWTSTTLANYSGKGTEGVYVSFGRATGYLTNTWVDVHGAGAQRSDPKSGNPADFPNGRGPQGDAIRITNHARCVRAGNVTFTPVGNPNSTRPSLNVEVTDTPVPPGVVQPAGGGASSGGDGSPSPEAINACSASTVGQACEFSTLLGTIHGICQQLINDQITQLVACMATIP